MGNKRIFTTKQRGRTKYFNPVLSKKTLSVVVEYPYECEGDMTLKNLALLIARAVQNMLGPNRKVKVGIQDSFTGDKESAEVG